MEEFIKNNKELFSSEEPDAEHFNRFMQKMEAQKSTKTVFRIKRRYSFAAVFIFLIFSAVLATLLNNGLNKNVTPNYQIKLANSDFYEVQDYYEDNFTKELLEFKQLDCKNSDINKNEILNELKNFETNYNELENELRQNSQNKLIINAMIMNMQERSEFLNKVIAKVKENC
jgi:hypothetical protein